MNTETNKSPRILMWDIETSFMLVKSFGLYNQNHSPRNIVQDWYIICISYKFLDEQVHTFSVDFSKSITDDRQLCIDMRDVILSADCLVHHNGNAFDLKKFNARLIFNGLEPMPPILCIDTLKEARKIFKFSSNKLDYIGSHLGLGQKLETGGVGLWDGVMAGQPEALTLMKKYCEQDVILLELVYKKLLGFMKGHPNLHSNGSLLVCPKCGSFHNRKINSRRTAAGLERQQFQCQTCYGYFTLKASEKVRSLTQN